MSQRKPNKQAWYSLGLVVMLCVAVLVIATGTTFARYQSNQRVSVTYNVRVPDQICLGTVSVNTEEESVETETFTPVTELSWETVDGVAQLKFAVANGISESDFSARDQQVRLRMIGSLGTNNASLTLTLPPEEGSTEERTYQATAAPIVEGTVLYQTYGPGWLYTFVDESGEEVSWELPGGDFSYISLMVTIDNPEALGGELSILQPQVIADVIQD